MRVTITIQDIPGGVWIKKEYEAEPDDEEVPTAYLVGKLLCAPPAQPKRNIWVDKFFPIIMTAWGVFAITWLAISIWNMF